MPPLFARLLLPYAFGRRRNVKALSEREKSLNSMFRSLLDMYREREKVDKGNEVKYIFDVDFVDN